MARILTRRWAFLSLIVARIPRSAPRWDRVLESAHGRWGQKAKGLFFLNGSSGFLPMGFVQALTAMDYSVIPLSGPPT